MKVWTWTRTNCLLFLTVGAIGTWCLTFASQSYGQCNPVQGNNAVYNPNCNPTIVGSSAFVDASVFANNSLDFCGVAKSAVQFVQLNYPSGAVIDARGVPYTNPPTSMTCGASPWSGITNPPPSTILLPAGNITIANTWVLPNGTRVIGEGSTTPLYNNAQTIIQACSASNCFQGSPQGTSLIQFGDPSCPSTTGCIGVILEDVTLSGGGNGQSIDGILNENSQELSYAKNVAMYQIIGTGLNISGSAQNSGPYTNITYDTGNAGVITSTCAAISNVSGGTRGIHGLTCISDSGSLTAIRLNSSNNSLEDIRIAGFHQGVQVGFQGTTTSNVLKNVWGDTIPLRGIPGPPTIIEMSNSVADLVLVGIQNPTSGTDTILDEATNTTLTDSAVAMYALGESSSGNGYSRFTTSPNAVTWITGSNAPSGPTCAKGSLYSCIGTPSTCMSGSQSGALWACTSSGTWSLIE